VLYFLITSGSNNIAFGQNAGCLFSGSSSNNIAIGFAAGPSTLTEESDKLYIATSFLVPATPLIKGDFAAKTVNISGSLIATSYLLVLYNWYCFICFNCILCSKCYNNSIYILKYNYIH
jgi:hypothetical protein